MFTKDEWLHLSLTMIGLFFPQARKWKLLSAQTIDWVHQRLQKRLNMTKMIEFLDRQVWANSVDRDQTVGAVWSGTALFAILFPFFFSFECITQLKYHVQILGKLHLCVGGEGRGVQMFQIFTITLSNYFCLDLNEDGELELSKTVTIPKNSDTPNKLLYLCTKMQDDKQYILPDVCAKT